MESGIDKLPISKKHANAGPILLLHFSEQLRRPNVWTRDVAPWLMCMQSKTIAAL